MEIIKGCELKLYPNLHQINYFKQAFGCNRKVWNLMLNMLNERHENNPEAKFLSKFDLNNLIKPLKNEYQYLKCIDSTSYQLTNEYLSQAFKNFFNKKLPAKYPRFKSRKCSYQSFTTRNCQTVDRHHVKLPKIGLVRVKGSIPLNNQIKRATITLLPTGHFHLSLIYKCENQAFAKTGQQVGIDMGSRDLAILSDGTKFQSHYFSRYYEHKLLIWKRKLARRRILAKQCEAEYNHTHKDDKVEWRNYPSYQKARIQVAKLHAKIKNKRKDYLHKVTFQIVKDFDVIAIENLNASNLLKNHNNARKLANQAWRQFRTMLEYKAIWNEKQLLVTEPAYTSQICSNCCEKNHRLGLDKQAWRGVETWNCANCGTHHDRDVNAAINILNQAVTETA